MKMKQIITIGAALLLLTAGSAQAQNSIEQVLRNIETNNKELQANAQLITSQKQSVSWWFRRASTSPAYMPRATS